MSRSFSCAVAVVPYAGVSAQSPHGGVTAKPQPGPNVNTAAGIVANPLDPAAFLQRQNETVVAASSRLDYRFARLRL